MTGVHGDEGLAARLRELVGDRHPVVAAATLTPRGVKVASVGACLDADFEIGSISKGITGLLYVDALSRGEIDPSMTLGELLPIGDVPAARVTLASVSTHHSGLPGLPVSVGELLRRYLAWRLHGTNPYGENLEQLITQARGVKLKRPRPRYSNFGFELLGHAIACAAGTSYQDLVRQRIADPLDLGVCYVPATPAQLRPGALMGRSRFGRTQQPWTGEAIGPAGGIRASIQDMARLTAALLDGSASGAAALDPVTEFMRRSIRIGAAWITLDYKRQLVTFHNGRSGGFATWLGLDRVAGTGVVLMSATSVPVDRHGFTLLAQLSGEEDR